VFATRNIKILLEYDGTNYAGWQRQKNINTIQEVLETAIEKITCKTTVVNGCSRTDTGVHAKGFVGNFYTESRLPINRIADAINSQLPQDIVVLSAEDVDMDFHARYFAVGKTYSYTILNRIFPSAINRNYTYHFRQKLDTDSMAEAAAELIGTHDFYAFKNAGSSAKTSVRTITELKVVKSGDIIKIYATADGFLYNMVRIIVGTLIKVGVGKIKSNEIQEILLSKDRTRAGKCVPPQGLCLEEVYY
jgi:tRNA pseudouridine38-40 synthase